MNAPPSAPHHSPWPHPLSPVVVSQLIDSVVDVRDPAGVSAVRGRFRVAERHMMGDTVLGYVIRLGGGVLLRVTPDWITETHADLPDNVIIFRPRGAAVNAAEKQDE